MPAFKFYKDGTVCLFLERGHKARGYGLCDIIADHKNGEKWGLQKLAKGCVWARPLAF